MWFYGLSKQKIAYELNEAKAFCLGIFISFNFRPFHFNPHEIRQQIENFPSCQPEHRGRDDQR